MALAAMLSRGAGVFDVRRHLGTKTRYAYRLAVPGAPSIYKQPDPEGYEPVHLWLMARHGTRWPTSDRMLQINSLESLFQDSRNTADHPWLSNWTAPFPDVGFLGGELHPIGADELWGLAYRLRKRFPSLAGLEYLPKRFPVVSTQVARTAASASAFTAGFFPEVGSAADPADDSPSVNPAAPSLAARGAGAAAGGGPGVRAAEEKVVVEVEEERVAVMDVDAAGRPRLRAADAAGGLLSAADELDASLREVPAVKRPQAVAMSMAPKAADPLLRFFDVCPAYAQHDEYTEKWMGGWMQGNWSALVPALEKRLGLSRDMDPCEVEALWQLCLLEAGLEGVGNRACSLFTPQEAMQLEWVDDIHLLETQSWGADINYRIAAPLLRDAALSLKGAAAAASSAPGTAAPAGRLLFAHCETLVPLATLMGLFRPPAPQPPDASAAAINAAVSAAAAQRHLLQVDTLEDLSMLVNDLHRLNDQDARKAATGGKARAKGRLGSEDSHSCYPGRAPVDPDAVPPPEGWYPMFPNDDSRLFKGSRLAPYAANMALVLYRRREGRAAGAAASGSPQHLVRLLYNEQVLPVPGCGAAGSGSDCDLDEFLELMEGKMDADALDRLCGPAATAARAAAATGGLRGDGGASLMFDRKGVPSKSLRHRPGGFVRGGGGSTGVGGSGGDGKVVVEGAAEAGSGVGGKVGGDVAAAS
ncbi:hypothetical protein CHLRE_13g568600v5 [Chlamydomonas reinhardtii]|uniref:Multiple inositol polyphosphate phosphatase 1 n=1 Tax=Chlamydomonas reinhardtii TaxID=3055 RepID=A0A2K3CZH5_CHLRE|nr:uncharacterized protein CHLRE_13g568600v5 [Chlamydomonas reinhardtii]XP_042917309.1 uncharacterized protein CHLRE_13g568600v5 [Chlamydomonas reinhardtii]PNW73688.1 hypothetical protein CHLRE_13g568600v5 [Chlamydomonas reinhardtii]PNW73690.1 hypothetical protein CHLRE_13g568600v5 [Chlamydomonas reinhardtii]